MLYDPKWEQKTETKADPFSLASLIAWLEKQPADRGYDYCRPEQCLVAQWLIAEGAPYTCLKASEVRGLFSGRGTFIVYGDGHHLTDWTFGAALSRARALAHPFCTAAGGVTWLKRNRA